MRSRPGVGQKAIPRTAVATLQFTNSMVTRVRNLILTEEEGKLPSWFQGVDSVEFMEGIPVRIARSEARGGPRTTFASGLEFRTSCDPLERD